jgi:hypothetical protein
MCPLPCSQTPSQVEPESPPGTVPCVVPLMCRRVRVSAANPPPRPLQANLAVSRGLFTRSQIWLIRHECCSRWPGLWTAGCARPQAILGCEASRIRSRIVENQPWRSRDSGPTNALLCVRRGCAPGQRCSQRADACTPSAPRARGTLTVPTACYRSQMVAVHGRPGRVCPRIGDCGIAFSNLWAWVGFGSPAWTHSSCTPMQPHDPDLNVVLGVCVCAG